MSVVNEHWSAGYKYFTIDLGDGEARMCLSPCSKSDKLNSHAYGVGGQPSKKTFYVDFLKVSPRYRNKGYGTELLKACMKWANITQNVIILDAIPLDAGIDQHRLARFYLAHGFKLAPVKGNTTSMYYHTRETQMKIQTPTDILRSNKASKRKIVELIRKTCQEHDITFRVGRGANVYYASGFKVSGYFDHVTRVLAVATGKPLVEYLPVLIHEYNHMLQWIEQCPVWLNSEEPSIAIDLWMSNAKEYPDAYIDSMIKAIIDVELDCERRTVDFMVEHGVQIDIPEYIKRSNSYVLFHNVIRETRKWYLPDKKPYNLERVWQAMPEDFSGNYYELTDEQKSVFAFCS